MLRHARRRARDWLRSVAPQRATLKTDALAGLPGAIGSVPDGMAASVLTGVNPIHGLYASFAGPVAGGLTASTKLMVITTTSAAALAAGSALEDLSPEERPGSAVPADAHRRRGDDRRRAPAPRPLHPLRQPLGDDRLPQRGGGQHHRRADPRPDRRPSRGIDRPAEGVGRASSTRAGSTRRRCSPESAALAIIVVLGRTRIAAFSAVVALAVPTIAVILAGADVAQVEDQGDIPRGVPLPAWPELSAFSVSLLAGALAVAAIVLVQGVGVAESAPNDDGSRSDANVDFVAQGVGNLSSGFFQGQPVGGSVGQTALNRTAGARTRWAAIFSGLWMLLILALFSGVVGVVAMPTLAALLIYAAAGSLRFGQIATIWRTGLTSQIAIAATFVATLLLPVATAVGLGVVLSLLLQLNQAALDLKVVELVPARRRAARGTPRTDAAGQPLRHPPRRLREPALRRRPHPAAAPARPDRHRRPRRRAADARPLDPRRDVLHRPRRLRRQLDDVGGRLYVAGLDPALIAQAERTGSIAKDGPVKLYEASPVIGESSLEAFHDAQRWVEATRRRPDEP